MIKAYKYRLYPNQAQSVLLDKHFGAMRFIYNLALETKNWAYLSHKKNLSKFDLMNQLPELRKENVWLKEIDSQAMQQSIADLDKAFTGFFHGHSEFPKYKSKRKSRQSFRHPHGNRIKVEDDRLYQPKFPDGIKMIVDRPYKGEIKSSTISKTSTGKYFVSILVDTKSEIPTKKPILEETTIGIDLGLKSFIVTSDGQKVDNPRFLKETLSRIGVLQKRLRKKKVGSGKWKKAQRQIALLHEHAANQRRDFLHKLSTELVNNHDTLCLETLHIKNMSATCKPKMDENSKYLPNGQAAKSGLNKSILDAGWGMFVGFCEYKSEWQGKNFLQIPTFEPSSKMCSCCGSVNKELTLNDREWTCQKCGTLHDRDKNAADNIKAFALNSFAATRTYSGRATPVVPSESPTLVGALKREYNTVQPVLG